MVNLPTEKVSQRTVRLCNVDPDSGPITVDQYYKFISRDRPNVTQAELEFVAEMWAIRLKGLTQLPITYAELRSTSMDFWRAKFKMEFKMVCREDCDGSCDIHHGDGLMTPER